MIRKEKRYYIVVDAVDLIILDVREQHNKHRIRNKRRRSSFLEPAILVLFHNTRCRCR